MLVKKKNSKNKHIVPSPHSGSDISLDNNNSSKDLNRLKDYINADSHVNYKNIFNLLSFPCIVVAADGDILLANFAGEELFEISQQEMVTTNFKKFVPDTEKYLIDNLLSTALLSGEKEVLEVELFISGKQIPVQISAKNLPSSFECLLEIEVLSEQEEKVELTEASYRTLTEEANVGIFIADSAGNYIAVNKFGCDLLGYSLEELLKLNIKDVLLPEEIKENPIQLNNILEGQNTFTARSMVRKDGSVFPVEISGKKLSDGRVQGIVHDLTKQKKVEKALIESEKNYKHAESIAHLGSWQMNIRTGESKWSDEFFRIVGYEPQSFKPTMQHRYQIVHPQDRDMSENAIRKAIEERSSYKIEKRVLRPNGEIRYVQSVGEIILDNHGEPVELKGVFLDITDLKNIELSLKQSEEKYKLLLEFLPIGLVIKNKLGEVTFQNSKSEQILKGENVFDNRNYKKYSFVRKDDSLLPLREFPGNKALSEGNPIENTEIGILINSLKIWLNASAAPIPGNEEEVIVAFMDITEKVFREKQLNELSEKLQELNATKDKFFSIIAHDLKNPFNSILGFSELLLKNIDNYSTEEIERFVGIISDTSQKTYNLLENLLIWSRAQMGSLEYNPDLYDLDNLVSDNIEFINTIAIKKQILVNYQSRSSSFAFVDKNMIDTVLRNILTNAVKFSYPEGEINVRILEQDDYYVISIKDDGIGIEAENICKIFRLDSKFTMLGTNKEKGTGLGLLISKEFIQKNNGQIWVNSELGKGSEFLISIPRCS